MILRALGIRKSFGNTEVLKGIDFDVRKGEVVAIVGASGAGKSTLLQILGTLLTPDSGSLEIDGRECDGLSGNGLCNLRSEKIGFVFQDHRLLPEFSALENVMIPCMIAGMSRSAAAEEAKKVLSAVGLADRLAHKPSELSGGEQQRVAIARAIVRKPAVLLADEPTGNLDSATKEEIHRLIFELRDKFSQTTVIVTHDSALAALCDRTVNICDGRIV